MSIFIPGHKENHSILVAAVCEVFVALLVFVFACIGTS